MTDDQKQKMKEYQKKYRETKKLNKIINKMLDLFINDYSYFSCGYKIMIIFDDGIKL